MWNDQVDYIRAKYETINVLSFQYTTIYVLFYFNLLILGWLIWKNILVTLRNDLLVKPWSASLEVSVPHHEWHED